MACLCGSLGDWLDAARSSGFVLVVVKAIEFAIRVVLVYLCGSIDVSVSGFQNSSVVINGSGVCVLGDVVHALLGCL